MTENVSIETRGACVDFPIYDGKRRSSVVQAAQSDETTPTSLSSKLCGT